MNAGNVSQFGCGRSHPTRVAYCDRQRHHAGDHRGRDATSGRLIEWPDPPYQPPQEDPVPDHADHEPTVAFEPGGIIRGDSSSGVVGELLEAPDDRTRAITGGFWAAAAALEVAVLVLLVLCLPAIVVAVYRWAF